MKSSDSLHEAKAYITPSSCATRKEVKRVEKEHTGEVRGATKRSEINKFISKLTNQGGHRDRVKAFCRISPKWNPIGLCFEDIVEDEKPI